MDWLWHRTLVCFPMTCVKGIEIAQPGSGGRAAADRGGVRAVCVAKSRATADLPDLRRVSRRMRKRDAGD